MRVLGASQPIDHFGGDAPTPVGCDGVTTAGTYDNATYAVFDRQLSLSTSNQRDGGMQAYLKFGTGAASASIRCS